MDERLQALRSAILARLPNSELHPMTASELEEVLIQYPDLPEHLRALYTVVGVGRIGDSRYAIHAAMEPGEVYDESTARDLQGVVLVGDDFAGTCEAYDSRRGWRFGSIGSDCEFSPREGCNFIDFLEDWYCDPAET